MTTPAHDCRRNITLQYPSVDKAEWTSFIAQLNELRNNRSYTKKYNFSQLRNTLNSEKSTKQCTKWLDKIVSNFMSDSSVSTLNDKQIEITVYHTGSTLEPEYEPDIWSPAHTQFIRLQEEEDGTVMLFCN